MYHILKPINELLQIRFKYASSARSNELRRNSSAKSGENGLRALSAVFSRSLRRAFTPRGFKKALKYDFSIFKFLWWQKAVFYFLRVFRRFYNKKDFIFQYQKIILKKMGT